MFTPEIFVYTDNESTAQLMNIIESSARQQQIGTALCPKSGTDCVNAAGSVQFRRFSRRFISILPVQ